jgi:rhomboid family GlyGly-CTERM serine protease
MSSPSNASLNPTALATIPWASLGVVAVALGLAAAPALAPSLLYDRAALERGEYWRLWTGHFVHFGWSHLLWNLAVFAVASSWAERVAPRRARVLLIVAPPIIGVALFGLDPELGFYGGLSGVTAAMLTFLAFAQLARIAETEAAAVVVVVAGAEARSAAPSDRWFWRTVLALIILKIAAEFAVSLPQFARLASEGIQPVPLAHLAGVLAATYVQRLRFRSKLLGGRPR